jgi:hypothetical protein
MTQLREAWLHWIWEQQALPPGKSVWWGQLPGIGGRHRQNAHHAMHLQGKANTDTQ